MRPTLPDSPADVLQVNAAPLRVVIRLVVGLAERLGFWKSPLRKAATATEEMSPLDNLYWIYKSRHPIARPEEALQAAKPLMTDRPANLRPPAFRGETSVTIGAGGDLLRSPGIDDSEDVLFDKVAHLLFDQDIAMANFESPITIWSLEKEVIGDAGPPVECCSRAQFDVLKGHRGRKFDILHTANNHMYDMGREGVASTVAVMQDEGILALGTPATPEEHGRASIVEKNGIRIGFVSDCFGLNGRTLPAEDSKRIHVSQLLSKRQPPDLDLLKRQIDDAKAKGADFIVASIHWGYEFEFFPRERQVEAARELVEYGADTLICHHPHVIQPVEYYRTKRDPERVALIAYSLGSLTWGFMAPHIVLSTILNLRLSKGTLDGEPATYLDYAATTPVFRTYVHERGRMVTRIERLADHVGYGGSPFPDEYISRIREHAELVLGRDWLPGQV